MARLAYICARCGAFNRGTGPCSGCSEPPAFARPAWEGVQVGKIDGEHSGYYDDALGFPKDPKNPAKSICPSHRAAKDAFARARDRTRGEVSYE